MQQSPPSPLTAQRLRAPRRRRRSLRATSKAFTPECVGRRSRPPKPASQVRVPARVLRPSSVGSGSGMWPRWTRVRFPPVAFSSRAGHGGPLIGPSRALSHQGDWCNGNIAVSKTAAGGSTPPSPADRGGPVSVVSTRGCGPRRTGSNPVVHPLSLAARRGRLVVQDAGLSSRATRVRIPSALLGQFYEQFYEVPEKARKRGPFSWQVTASIEAVGEPSCTPSRKSQCLCEIGAALRLATRHHVSRMARAPASSTAVRGREPD